jgi:dihydroflavonol-4-reductase
VKPTLITGASGFVGWHVARLLLERGHRVRALVRDPARLQDLDGIEPVRGDLRDAASLAEAVAGCGVVFHVAADYRLWTREPGEMYRSNVEGTRNLLESARQAGVERFVYTSTVACVGVVENGLGDEQVPVSLAGMQGPYKRSKFQAEQVAREYAAGGFPVVIVNPTTPVGERDVKPTPSGKIIVDFVRGAIPAFIDTGLNLVDVRDAAQGHLLACERGVVGQRYILGCENVTYQQILERLAAITGRPAPRVRLPYPVAYAVGIVSTGLAWITGREPIAPLDAVRIARKKLWVRHEKASRELGYTPTPVEGALRRAVEWFQAHGYC